MQSKITCFITVTSSQQAPNIMYHELQFSTKLAGNHINRRRITACSALEYIIASALTRISSVLEAVNRGRDTSLTINKLRAAEIIDSHNRRMA